MKSLNRQILGRSFTARLIASLAVLSAAMPLAAAYAALEIEIITAPNFVVDSNVLTPATYAPKAAMIGAKFCNTGSAALTNVRMYAGDYNGGTGDTPGMYPKRYSNTFSTAHPPLYRASGGGYYSLTHEGGSAGSSDAFRYIASIPAGQCQAQYWLVSYPSTSSDEKEAASALSPRSSVTGGSGPEDDLWLEYDIWAKADGVSTVFATRKATMRNEISAAANKIWPNGDNKVPVEYKEAIDAHLGWDTKTPSGTTDTYPGDIALAQGVWYDFGVIGAGFDNNGDLVPDHNAWAQPIGDAGAYDPGCFRLVSTEAYVLVKRQDGSIDIFDYKDRLYFENMPDNTGAVGLVFYKFTALDGKCTAALSPYQEVASGYDNEKFNGDYGVGTPPLQSASPSGDLPITKSGPATVTAPASAGGWADMQYNIAYKNNRTAPSGSTGVVLSVGDVESGSTTVVRDTVPAGTYYKIGSAQWTLPIPQSGGVDLYTPGAILFSTDGGVSWSATQPADTSPADGYADASDVRIQWWLASVLPSTADKGDFSVKVEFKSGVPYGYSGSSVISNTGALAIGTGPAINEATATTLVSGPNALSGTVFKDLDIDGVYDTAAPADTTLANINVKLYADLGVSVIDGLLDINGDGVISAADDGTFGGYNVVNGFVDLDNDGLTGESTEDGSIGIDGAWTVIDGKVNVNVSDAVINTSDDGRIWDGVLDAGDMLVGQMDSNASGAYNFGSLPDGVYFAQVDTQDSNLFVGAAPTTATLRTVKLDIVQGDGNDTAPVSSTGNDFGFIEPLKVTKAVTSTTSPYGDGENITYSLTVKNQLPASGSNVGGRCVYTLFPASGNGGAAWTNEDTNSLAVDGSYFTVDVGSNPDTATWTGFKAPAASGTVVDVRVVVYDPQIVGTNDWDAGETLTSTIISSPAFVPAVTVTSAPFPLTTVIASSTYEFTDLFADRAAWSWSDIDKLSFTLTTNKSGNPGGDLRMDAVALQVTSSEPCPASSDNILTDVKLQDKYEKAKLDYASSSPAFTPPEDTASDATYNILTWNNLGPLSPGESKVVTVTMKGDNTASQVTAQNTALVAANDAKLGDGRFANSGSSTANVPIYPAVSISGKLFADKTAGWNTASPYGDDLANDTYLPGQTVALWACATTATPRTVLAAGTENQDCNSNSGYDWYQIATATTASDGSYIFEGVTQGYYFVKAPATSYGGSVTAAPPDVNNPTSAGGLNDAFWYDPTNGGDTNNDNLSTFFRVGGTSGNWTDSTNVDFGYGISGGAVSGYVWDDANGNGAWDSGEAPLTGVMVTVNGVSKTTDSTGYYQFTGADTTLTAGTSYNVVLTTTTGAMTGYSWTQTYEQDGTLGNSLAFTAAAGTMLTSRNFGWRWTPVSSTVSGTLYYDWDGDGTKDTIDPGAANVTVYLYEDKDSDGVVDAGTDAVFATAITAADGSYQFTSLPSQKFIVVVDETDPDGKLNLHQQVEDPDVAVGGGVCIGTQCDGDGKADVTAGSKTGIDFGYQPQGSNSIGGQVWRDLDSDTVKDGGQETGISDVTVTLQWTPDSGTTWYNVRTTTGSDGTTDVDGDGDIDPAGSYYFGDLPNGTFRVVVSETDSKLPKDGAGTTFTPTTGTDSGTTRYFQQTLSGGTATTNNDFGFTALGAIGDTIYMDVNKDGEQDTLEPGIKDVKVTLWTWVDADGNGKWDGEALTDTGRFDTTDADGRYLFDGLAAGHYLVKVDSATLPQTSPGVPLKLIGDPDSDGVPCNGTDGTKFCDNQHGAAITSTYYLGADFGYEAKGVLGDTLWLDVNKDGKDYYDLNGNGSREADEPLEPRLVGVTVKLCEDVGAVGTYEPGTDTSCISVDTDADGMYLFSESESQLVAGKNYVVETDSADLPDMIPSYNRDGGTATPDYQTFISNWTANNVILNADFGFRYNGTAKVAGTVCFEAVSNGYCGSSVSVQGVASDESGYDNVSLNLYIWNDDGDGTVEAGETVYAGSTYTASNGDYTFDNLPDNKKFVVTLTTPEQNLIFNTTEAILGAGVIDDLRTNPAASSTPVSTLEGSVLIAVNGSVTGLDFAFTQNFDYGDLPFATLRSDSGARHIVKSTPDLYLGTGVTKDTDGVPSYLANGETDSSADGITLVNPLAWTEGADGGTIRAVVAGSGWLMGWIDFNNDGVFSSADDMVISQAVSTGTNNIAIDIPSGGLDTMGYARFRLFPSEPTLPELAYTGTATNGEVEDYAFFTSSVGDRIWLDEDGNGVQDAGEDGIANVTVKLCDTTETHCRTTVTDTSGNYLFPSIGAGTYKVIVNTATLPAALAANPTFDYDSTLDSKTQVTVTERQEFVDADFGYNYVSKTSTDNPPAGATGVIGDRIWNDGDGDGVQDPEEAGIAGVTVTLYSDPDRNGIYDTPAGTATTNAAGNYVFSGLAAGAYKVVVTPPAGTVQTGDPDAPVDNATTAPIILSPGDVYVNADFGYQYTTRYTIGDTIYRDISGDGTMNGSDSGIAGVTVVLKDASGKIIATDVTDSAGKYTFVGLPGGVNYTVEVTDTAHVLGELALTDDPDSTLNGSYAITNLSGNIEGADFGYAPLLYARETGAIGDIVFLDGNGSDSFNIGEALEGVRVDLYRAGETTPIRTTYTDENGNYLFAGLKADTYRIEVVHSTLPGGLAAADNNVNTSGTTGTGTSTENLTTGEINLSQDFGYKSSVNRTVTGTIWDDRNADGFLSSESGIPGVTVALIDKSTGNIVARATTDGSGNYTFSGLSADEYQVQVTDDAGKLSGFWHTVGSNATADGYSKIAPYTVDLTAAASNNTADFGYYKNTASVGDTVWLDSVTQDGINSGEPPIANHLVTLIITYPNGDKVTVVTKTDASGQYTFANLLADEDYNATKSASGDLLPAYLLQTSAPAGMDSTHTTATDLANADNQASNPAGEFVSLTKGQDIVSKDFAFYYNGAIGDYVWLDIDGDGVQDNNEPPLDGVTVKLYIDGGDGSLGGDDTLKTSAVTDIDGSYLFENLPAGTYWVQIDSGVAAGLEVTADATHDSTADQTKPADKVVLAANGFDDTVDFGFTSTAAMLGDTVWFDRDPDGSGPLLPDGIQNPGEIGIAGVGLFLCENNLDPCNGSNDIDTASTGPTVTTGIDGTWLRTGLNSNATYTVAVDTSSAALTGLNTAPTNGAVRRTYTLPASGGVLLADYGFTDDSTANFGAIGNRVYFDTGNNSADDGTATDPGIAGVVADLLINDSGTWKTVAQTTTDADGNYLFSGLLAGRDYRVQLNDSNSSLAGFSATQKPAAGYYSFTPSAGTLDKLDADYGFYGAGLGDYVWFDSNGNGIQDAGETGIGGVEVKLYLDNGTVPNQVDAGDTLVRTTTTDSSGHYLFSGIAAGQQYVVKMTSPAEFTPSPAGAGTSSTDSNGNASNEAAVNFTGTTFDIDFGLKGGTLSIGDRVWRDSDGQGDQDESNAGIGGVTIDLYLGNVRIASTVTAADGSYSFSNLPASNTYEVRITDLNNILGNLVSTTGGDSRTVSNLTASVDSIDFGYNYPVPTYALVSSFKAYVNDEKQTVLEWKTDSEVGTLGFLLERLNEKSGEYEAVSEELLPGMLIPLHGGTYRFVDPAAEVGESHTYRVIEVAVSGQGTVSGPYTVKAEQPLPVNRKMFADGPAGFTLAQDSFSVKQIGRAAVRVRAANELAAQKKKKTGQTVKVPVSKDGLVYLTAADLAAASGLQKSQVVNYLKAGKGLITLAGKTVPALFSDTGTGLWFYGQAPERTDIGQNIYLLKLGDRGKKIKSNTRQPKKKAASGQSFAAKAKAEENNLPFHLYINTPVRDFWAWEYLLAYKGEASASHAVSAPHLSGRGAAAVAVNLVAVSNSSSPGSAAPYKVSVFLNGSSIGTEEWSEKGDHQFRKEVSADLLKESGNEVKIVSALNSGVTWSFIYLDSIEVEYQRMHQADSGELRFSGGQQGAATVSGFKSGRVLALDITDPAQPVRLKAQTGKQSDGSYAVTVATEPDHAYFVTENIANTVSEDMTADTPSDLRNPANQADYLIISPLNMQDSARRLAEHREGQGLKTMLIDIEDVQDEFSASLAAPEAVHDFLAHVHASWAHVPDYVVLIGDGSYDYKNHLGYGWPQVPSVLVAAPDGFFPSDNAFADVDGDDGVPEFAIGRIPAVDSTELNVYIDKLLVYEQAAQQGSGVLSIVTDKSDPAAGDFQASAGKVAALAPTGFTVSWFDVDTLGEGGTHSKVVNALSQGSGILHYVGHSSLVAYGRKGSLLTASEIESMRNLSSPMLMVSMSCSSASFGYPPMNSIGESAVLRAGGAAVGFFGATGLSRNYLADIMAQGFYRSLSDSAVSRIGDAVVQGKQHYFSLGAERYPLDIYNLLGDPAALTPVSR